VVLTSGTTGTPKGAPRTEPRSLALVGGLLSKVPFRAREVTELCVPTFHSLGFAHMTLALALGSTLVVRRHFDPERTLDSLSEHEATALIVVPVMLARLLDLGDQALADHDLDHLKIIFAGGSQLGGELCQRAMRAFGPIVYNLYGSTEVAWATVASPQDLRAAPGTAGRPPRGTVVKILDPEWRELPAGSSGRIFVGSEMLFEGYTGGGDKLRGETSCRPATWAISMTADGCSWTDVTTT
jgi:fatty-acyl-CoA synthase